jgi:phage terminase large subunit
VDIYRWGKAFILDERFYRKGVSNQGIAKFLKFQAETMTYADSSEPKSIDEISFYEVDITGAQKGPGSINQGIQYVQDQTIYYTSHSLNLIKEYRNYLWQTDRDGRIINKPEDMNNHLCDALRYGLETYIYSSVKGTGFVAPKRQAPAFPLTPVEGVYGGGTVSAGLDIGKLLNNKNQRGWQEI